MKKKTESRRMPQVIYLNQMQKEKKKQRLLVLSNLPSITSIHVHYIPHA